MEGVEEQTDKAEKVLSSIRLKDQTGFRLERLLYYECSGL
jgi:hypothetical protein